MEQHLTNPVDTHDPAGAPAEEPKPAASFDDILKDPAMQAEFDRRMTKGLNTAKAKWEQEQSLTAEQLAEQKAQERAAELDKREAELNQRAMHASALESLGQKGLPAALADALEQVCGHLTARRPDLTDAETLVDKLRIYGKMVAKIREIGYNNKRGFLQTGVDWYADCRKGELGRMRPETGFDSLFSCFGAPQAYFSLIR